jgi:hypothetical protein
MIHPDDVTAWLAQARQNPEAAPGIIEALAARLIELDEQNEALRDELVRLRPGQSAVSEADQVAALTRRVQTLERQLERSAQLAPGELARSLLVFALDGRAARLPFPGAAAWRQRSDPTLVAGHLRPRYLLVAADDDGLVLFTDKGRAVRLRVSDIAEAAAPVHYLSLLSDLVLDLDESLGVALALPASFNQLTLVTRKGFARSFRQAEVDSFLERHLPLHSSPVEGDYPALALFGDGKGDVLAATRLGRGARFPARVVGVQPQPVIQLERGDGVIGAALVDDRSTVALVSADGTATRREMAGFGAHPTAGHRGKLLTRIENLVAAAPVQDTDTLWLLTATGQLLPVPGNEIPASPGASGGKRIAELDAVVAIAVTPGA